MPYLYACKLRGVAFMLYSALIIALLAFCPRSGFAEEIMVRAPTGEQLFVEVNPEESFSNVINRIGSCVGHSENMMETFCLDFHASASESKSLPFRDYWRENSKEDTENLSYIICTMGFKSLAHIWSERKALKSAGDKLDHLHPLRFTMGIFTDEKMKAAMHNVVGSLFTWREFKKGLYTTLTVETKNGNMALEYMEDFAKRVKVDKNLIIRPLQQEKWDEFINVLIKHVPRAGDPKRYDM